LGVVTKFLRLHPTLTNDQAIFGLDAAVIARLSRFCSLLGSTLISLD